MGNAWKKAGNAALVALTGYEVGQSVNNNNEVRIEVVTVKVPTQTSNNSTSVYEIILPYIILLVAVVSVLAINNWIKKCLKMNVNEGRVFYQAEQPRQQVQVQIPQQL